MWGRERTAILGGRMPADATAARQHTACPRAGRAAVAAALNAIERRSNRALALATSDPEAFGEDCEAIRRLAAGAAEDTRRLVDSFAVDGDAGRELADEVHDEIG